MTLRPALADDAAAMAEVHARAFDSPWTAGDIATLLQGPGGFGVVADGGAAGFVLARAIAGEAEILTLAVRPDLRRRGLGAALLAAATGLAAAMGADALFLEVAEDNAAARALYRGAGFAVAGRRRAYYARPGGTQQDALVMRLELNSARP